MITKSIDTAKEELNKNGIVAIPTETVYGLAGNAFSEEAVEKIFALKRRPHYNPLIVHIKSADYLTEVASDIPATAMLLAKTFWPGALTLLLKKKSNIPDVVTAGKSTLAVRVPNHPLTLNLLAQLNFPLAAPSANPFGSISPTSAEHVYNYFKEDLAVILDGGNCNNGVESTIIGFENNQPILYRHGAISVEDIEKIIGKVTTHTKDDDGPLAPGMLSKHYSPNTSTYLTDNVEAFIKLHPSKKIGLLLFKDSVDSDVVHQEILSEKGDLNEAAKNLYAAMHRLDKLNLDMIVAEIMPNNGLGKTINDRLKRAVEK